jgi:hypothetical protein
MCDLANIPVSLFHGSFDSEPKRTVTLSYILESIRTGTYARQVRHVRQVLATRGQAAYDKAKSSLIAITFAGTFAPTRGNAHLQKHSGLLHIDIDHLHDVAATKQELINDPYIIFAFISPSGGGIKAGVRIPIITTAEGYAHAWHTVRAVYESRYGVNWDQATKDVARLCYVSYDPELFVNLDAEVFAVPPMPSPAPQPPTPTRHAPLPYQPDRRRMYAERAIRTATDMIQSAQLGSRHHARLKAARLLGGYVAGGVLTEDEAYSALAQALVGYTEHLKRALKTVKGGLRYGQAHPISLQDLEHEREEWLETHVKSRPRQPSPVSPPANPWDGIKTLPLRPFARHRGIQIRGRQVRDG